jgi:hypothetical protein
VNICEIKKIFFNAKSSEILALSNVFNKITQSTNTTKINLKTKGKK